ncbi:MAG TPA: hypothetical protein VJY62_05415, partial [Bacteroidia bacterium]|nr:hypothetical protein [Bacteroidia bacterium]
MKTKLTFFIYFFALHVSFSQTFFNKGYQFGIPPVYLKTIQLPDKGYFLYGGSDYPAAGFIGKIDTSGTMLWGNRYEYSNSMIPPVFWSAVLDHNQHVVIATQGDYPDIGSLLKADTSGNIIWDIQFNFPITNVLLTSDSNYAVLGCQSGAAGSNPEVQFYKISPAGSVIFGHEYFNTTSPTAYNIQSKYTSGLIEYPDGNYYLLTCVQPGSIFVMKIDPNGQLIWNKKYIQLSVNNWTDSPSDGTWKMILMPDTTLFICGSSYHITTTEIICFKINLNGNVLWSQSYSSGTVKNGVINAFLDVDSTVVLFTALIDSGNYINDHAVLKIDQNGVLLNNFSFRNSNDPVYPMWFAKDNYSHYNFIQYAGFDPINNYDTIQITRIDSLFQSPCVSDTTGP